MNRTKDENLIISKAILKIRQDNKLSQEQFAEKIGVTRQAVSRWEMGISVPNMNTFILISEKFGVPLDAMLKESENVTEQNVKTSCGFPFLIIGILSVMSLPFLAEWQQRKNMELFKTAYEYSYNYIFEYPLSIIFLAALILIGTGIYLVFKQRRRFDEKND